MAFTTTPGASGTDFIGTDSVDSLFAIQTTGTVSVDGKAGADIIDISNTTGVIADGISVFGRDGNDRISFEGASGGDNNQESVIRGISEANLASVNGGQGDDRIELNGSTLARIRGNAQDDNIVLSGDYNNTFINGGEQQDSYQLDGAITLQSSKLLGGKDEDGSMNFAGDAIASAVDSTINGGEGVDQITMGQITRATNFTIFGGKGDDRITSANNGADGVVYSGDLGDDTITITGDADASLLGGEGGDTLRSADGDDTVSGADGNDTVNSGAGADVVTLGAGNDTFTDAAGSDTITGGEGADSFAINNANANSYVIDAISESGAAVTGTANTFDTFTGAFDRQFQNIDITAVSENLLGDAVTGGTVVSRNALAAGDGSFGTIVGQSDATTFAALRNDLSEQLTASNALDGANVRSNELSMQFIEVDGTNAAGVAGAIDGTYLIMNNTNTVLDGGDLMFEVTLTATGTDAAGALDGTYTAADLREFNFDADTQTRSAWFI